MHHEKFNQFLRDTIIAGLFKKNISKFQNFLNILMHLIISFNKKTKIILFFILFPFISNITNLKLFLGLKKNILHFENKLIIPFI